MNIKVLGAGCKNCQLLHHMTEEALKQEGLQADLEYITDMQIIPQYVMTTPGLVIDGVVVHEGKPLPSAERVRELIRSRASR